MRKTLFIQMLVGLTALSLLIVGCTARDTGETAPPSSQAETAEANETDSEPAPPSSQSEAAEASQETDPEPAALPSMSPQVRQDLESMLSGSSLISIAPDGAETRILFPGKGYTNGQLSADGRSLLCRKDRGGAGESFWSGYVLIDLQSMEEWELDGIQMGLQNHVLLPNGKIGFADGNVVGGQEDTWRMFQLYDLHYRPVELDWQFDFGQLLDGYEPRTENCPTGIGYSLAGGYYIVTYAQDLTHLNPDGEFPYDFPNASSRLGVALLDDTGAVIKQALLPEQYAAPFTYNVIATHPNNPVATRDGRILLRGMDADENIVPLLLDPTDWSVTELPSGGDGLKLSPEGTTAFAKRYYKVEEGPDNLLLHFDGGEVTTTQLPDQWLVEGYGESFHIDQQVAVGEDAVYVAAYSQTGEGADFRGIFRWDGDGMTLVRLVPDLFRMTLLGTDQEGNLLLLLHGIGDSENEDVQASYEDRRELILEMLQKN